ncbi:ArsR family transcriptional regulator [Paenibacillaceae bacterium]|nr:ArsR family transcriptional regulator [Paenibacillaceae bacterium]
MTAPPSNQDVFQAISDPTRRQLLELLADQELPIAALASRFPLSRTAINKHLSVLSHAGLVSARKSGRETRFRLTAEPLAQVKQWMSFFEQYWDDRLVDLKKYVESDVDEQPY